MCTESLQVSRWVHASVRMDARSWCGEKQNGWLSARSRCEKNFVWIHNGISVDPGSVSVGGVEGLVFTVTGLDVATLFCWMYYLIHLQLDYVVVIGYIVTVGIDTCTYFWKVVSFLLLLYLKFLKGYWNTILTVFSTICISAFISYHVFITLLLHRRDFDYEKCVRLYVNHFHTHDA
jgi:hypothetical protein